MTANLTGSLKPAEHSSADFPVDGQNGAWREIDCLLQELAALVQTDISPQKFYARLLNSATTSLAASGGAVWQMAGESPAISLVQLNYPALPGGKNESRRWSSATGSEATRILPSRSDRDAAGSKENPFDSPLLVCRLLEHTRGATIIEIVLPSDTSPEVQQGSVELFEVFREVALEFDRWQELKALRRRGADLQQFDEFLVRIHDSLDPVPTAYTLANDGRLWIGCDRVSVVGTVAGRAKTLAVSGVDHIDGSSAEVRALQALAAAVAGSREPLVWMEGQAQDLPPELDHARGAYLDLVHARRLIVLPLRPRAVEASAEDQPTRAILVAESYDEQVPEDLFRERVSAVARHGGAALLAALSHHDLPLLPLQVQLSRLLRFVRQRWVALLLTLGLLISAVAVLTIVPADFSVEARGTLEPEVRRHLFAPADGVVERVLAAHGQQVGENEAVLLLRDPRLDLDFRRVSGELQTARARLDSVRASRSRRSTAPDVRAEDHQLAAEEEQLKEEVRGLESQRDMLDELRAALRVASPIDGVVLTWNTEDLLQDRPVKQGQLLVTVADSKGPWVVELQIADADVGHVLAEQHNKAAALPVSFLLATDSAKTHRGEIQRVALATDSSDGESPTAQAIVRVAGPLPRDARAGARVTARIDCGQRSLGYVWLHDLIDAIRTHVLF